MLWLLLVSSFFAECIDGEIISVHDATPERGLPQTLTFYVKRGQQNVKLSLQQNNRKHQSTAVRSQQSLVSKSYEDHLHGGSFEVSLTKQNTGRYLRTLTGNFLLNGELVHIKPMMVSRTHRTRANTWKPYILLTNEEMNLRSVPGSQGGDNLLVRYLLAQRAEKIRTADATVPSDMVDMAPQSSYLSEETAPAYSIEKRQRCRDSIWFCKEWLNDYYQNNLENFCGRDQYERWCCNTCYNWDVVPDQCTEDLRSDCQEMLQYDFNNDYDAFCPTWGESCCATCSRKQEGNCVDNGYLGLSCQALLDWAVHGDMEQMCIHYKIECCAMCSENGSRDL